MSFASCKARYCDHEAFKALRREILGLWITWKLYSLEIYVKYKSN